ncbi:DsbA family protein [Ancylobacter sp. VNQ12]|uniref:DsbA family protein n=1 Tax=Ancylobacter sp. VNQ12 TaxID=3400920 RepID=UPI003C095A4D
MRRRDVLLAGAAAAGLLAGVSGASAQRMADKILGEPGPLPERVFGSPDAKVTVIEYASLTCHHCRDFHVKTWPAIKAKYVDTGRVRFILREFPLDQMALGGFMLARCAGEERWYDVVDTLYRKDDAWAHAPNPLEGLRGLLTPAYLSAEKFEACLSDSALQEKVLTVSRNGTVAGVAATPTFFINGKPYSGFMTVEQFSRLIDPLL